MNPSWTRYLVHALSDAIRYDLPFEAVLRAYVQLGGPALRFAMLELAECDGGIEA